MNKNAVIAIAVIAVVVVASVGFYFLIKDSESDSPFVGTWKSTEGSFAGYDSAGNKYVEDSGSDEITVFNVRNGFASLSFGGNLCTGVVNGSTINCLASGSGPMSGWVFYDALTLIDGHLRLTYAAYNSDTYEYRVSAADYYRGGNASHGDQGGGSAENSPIALGTGHTPFEAYSVIGGVKADALFYGYELEITDWQKDYCFFTVSFDENGVERVFKYVSIDIGNGVHINICRNGDRILMDYLLTEGEVITFASSVWLNGSFTSYIVRYSDSITPSPASDYTYLESMVFEGNNRYVLDKNSDEIKASMSLTIDKVDGSIALIRTDFNGTTSEWGAILSTDPKTGEISMIADAHFLMNGNEYSGIYYGTYDKERSEFVLTGNAYSGSHNLALKMNLKETE